MPEVSKTVAELADIVGGTVEGDGRRAIIGIRGLAGARAAHLSFLSNPKYARPAETPRAGALGVAFRRREALQMRLRRRIAERTELSRGTVPASSADWRKRCLECEEELDEALSVLVLAKLPFQVFTDPIVEARRDAVTKAGQDGFNHYLLPSAVLKFRQGFGRLIRSRTDRGVIVLADRRILSRRYGGTFLDALPVKAHRVARREEMVKLVNAFFAAGPKEKRSAGKKS